ncbi:formate dehydrogenase subunit gamma [Chromobacterium haemolyticum]|uniref:formate dehydrogenase subunit gamma n=1 Tax=Chromobacterium haemolyticum TaxID=394935 RepID=UPI0002FB55A6|nr:formate dehydrogenase subunit gamma [Chromobacterium haemolyticum]
MPLTAEQQVRIAALIASHQAQPGGLLPLLHAVQDELGYVPDAAKADIARAFRLSRAEVRGVLSFYHDFRDEPPARHELRLCRAEACQSMGSEALAQRLRARTGLDDAGRSADGGLALRPVYCLGACACAPALLLDGELHARVDAAVLDALLAGCLEEGGAC